MSKIFKPLLAAIGFLTAMPLPAGWYGDEKDLGRSLPWFVVVGALIGGAAALLDRGVSMLLPVLPSSVVVVFFMIAVSRALHLDGLADTADGFFSSRPKEKILEIMKDSRTGAMGVAAIVFVVLMKVAVISSLSPADRMRVIFLIPIAGRFAPVLMIATMKYVRGNLGLGTVFSKNSSTAALVISTVLFVAAFCGIEMLRGLIAAGAVVLFVVLFAVWSGRKIGGYTGDTLGASVEMTELAAALAFLIVLRVI